MEQFKEFVVKYFKIIVVVLSFSLTLYIQHVNNTAQIAELETKCIGLEVEIKNQYDRINAMKLDKSVFEATMMQLNTVQNDLHEIRADIRELLKCQNLHKLPDIYTAVYDKYYLCENHRFSGTFPHEAWRTGRPERAGRGGPVR